MKMMPLVLIVIFSHAPVIGYGQITLKGKNVPAEKIWEAIERQTQYVFLYDPGELKMGPVTISVRNASLQQTLGKIFKDLPIEFTLVGNNVLLKRKSKNPQNDVNADISLSGKVVDEYGQPLAAVTILNKGRARGTETDSAGLFMTSAAKGDILKFSFVGLKEKQVRVGDQRYIYVMLEVNPSNPEQVVVMGYGSSKKKDLTGSVAVVDVKGIGETPFNTVDNALAGRAAGVQITKTDGTPGGMVRVRVRGSSSLLGGNDPLYVIDGLPVLVRSNFIDPGFQLGSPPARLAQGYAGAAIQASFVNGLNSLGGLNPDDIESLTILKDASSTAIYGSKAANGVVIITTKTGKTNTPPLVTASYYSTVTSPYKTPRLLNTVQYKTLLTEAAQNAFDEDIATGNAVDPLTKAILDSSATFFGTVQTDWVKEVTRATISHNASLSVTGGGRASKYFGSLSYSNTPGVINGTDHQRMTAKLNLETQAGKKMKFASNLLLGYTDQNIGDGAYAQALLARPDRTPRDASGNYVSPNVGSYDHFGFINPVALLNATNNGKTLSLWGSFAGMYAITPGVQFRSVLSLDLQYYNQRNYLPSYIPVFTFFGNDLNPGGIGSEANSRFTDWFLENTLSYSRRFSERHVVDVVAGQSYETTKSSYFRATAAGYPEDNFLSGLSSASTMVSVAGDHPRSPQSYLLSFYIRANYSYLDKYLLTFTGRTDGSSRFGPDNKFGYFPSGAIAWRISRENFLKNVRWINDIKIRGSYGLTGNQNIGDQMYRTLYSPNTYGGNSALVATQLGNPGIKWESTRQVDAGADVSLFNGSLNATFDYYHRQTGSNLLSLPIAPSASFGSLFQNAVGLRNRGFEITVSGEILRSKDLKWTASINVSWNRSLITRLDKTVDFSQIVSPSGLESVGSSQSSTAITPEGSTILLEGQPVGLITGRFISGIIKTQAELDAYKKELGYNSIGHPLQIGDPIYKLDPSNAAYGYQNLASNVVIGYGPPKYFGGMTQEFSYRNLSLQLYFTFSKGGQLLWVEHAASMAFFGTSNANIAMFERYTPAHANATVPRLDLNATYFDQTNLDVFSSSYVKLRSLNINYRFKPSLWMKRAAINNLQIFVSATNVFTVTKYPGSDPETSNDPYSVSGGYVDAGNYPAVRTFSLGLKASF